MLVFLQSICCIIGIIQTYTCNFLHAQSLSEPKLILKIYKEIVLNLKKNSGLYCIKQSKLDTEATL